MKAGLWLRVSRVVAMVVAGAPWAVLWALAHDAGRGGVVEMGTVVGGLASALYVRQRVTAAFREVADGGEALLVSVVRFALALLAGAAPFAGWLAARQTASVGPALEAALLLAAAGCAGAAFLLLGRRLEASSVRDDRPEESDA